MKMSGNTIFITGATSGIGRGLAEAFHKLGNKVIVSGRRQDLLDEIARVNPGIEGIRLDIADEADIRRVAAELTVRHPDLNVLINNAGIMPFDDAAGQIDDAQARRIIDTNLLGPIRMTSALIDHLKGRQNAVIINNTSVLAFVPLAFTAVYSATKAALHSYSLSQRFLLKDAGVSVVEIAPPWVNADLVKKSDDPRAMPLDAFIEQTMAALAGGADEALVAAARDLRNAAGPEEHGVVREFNAALVANPIPV